MNSLMHPEANDHDGLPVSFELCRRSSYVLMTRWSIKTPLSRKAIATALRIAAPSRSEIWLKISTRGIGSRRLVFRVSIPCSPSISVHKPLRLLHKLCKPLRRMWDTHLIVRSIQEPSVIATDDRLESAVPTQILCAFKYILRR